jgi:integrase
MTRGIASGIPWQSQVAVIMEVRMIEAESSQPGSRRTRRRRRKSPNGAGGVYFNRTTDRWIGQYTTEDPETGLSVRKSVYGRSEQEARAKLIDALAARQNGTLQVNRGRTATVRQYAERWLAGLRLRPTTRARYRQALAHVIGDDRLGNLPLTKLRPQHVKGLLAALHTGTSKTTSTPLKSRSCNRVRDVLRNMLNDAMREGPLTRNVAELTKPLPLDDASKRIILNPELGHFTTFVELCENHEMGPLWMLALCTARRESELLGLRWEDVAWSRNTVRIERQLKRLHSRWYLEDLKTGERGQSTITLPDVALDMLRLQEARQREARQGMSDWSDDWPDLVFTIMRMVERKGPGRRPVGGPGDPLQPTTVSKGFPAAMVAAGLPRMRFHDLRHSAASFLLHMGIPPLEVARILGHSSGTTTTTIYAHALKEETSPTAAQVMGEALRKRT